MRKLSIFASTLLMLLLVSSCQKSIFTDSVDQEGMVFAKKTTQKPFRGTLNSAPVAEVNLTCDCIGDFSVNLAGSGVMSHMGRVYTEGVSCVTPQDFGVSIDGCVSLIAANGDEIFSEVEPYDMFIDTECFCRLTGTTSGIITGGTGRFLGASGEVDILVIQDTQTLESAVTIDGFIVY